MVVSIQQNMYRPKEMFFFLFICTETAVPLAVGEADIKTQEGRRSEEEEGRRTALGGRGVCYLPIPLSPSRDGCIKHFEE